jgi:C-terminal processing protease CtpA/Prc
MTIYAKPNESFVIPFKTDFAPLGLILKNNEIEINHIVPDTNAAKAGIEVGDIKQ